MSELTSRLKVIVQRIHELSPTARLIAVSKTKPVTDIIELYRAGQRFFGENYLDELEKKSNDALIRSECPDIRWHFIGHLHRKKAPRIVTRVSNLDCIQTVDSTDLAQRLHAALQQHSRKMNILLQINTSRETQKYGIARADFLSLYEYIRVHCPSLVCQGLMTIGSLDNVQAANDEDFQVLSRCREELCAKYSRPPADVELSMGMSHDYERAIQAGSTMIRVGSSIFGARN